MTEDIPPRKAMLLTLGKLKYARSPQAQCRILDLAERMLEDRQPGELSTLAKRILSRCAGQQMNIKSIARVCGVSCDGGGIFKAIKELQDASHAKKVDRGLYEITASTLKPVGETA